MAIYSSELLRVTNSTTGVTRYYVKKCDTFQRISKEEYDKRFRESEGVSNMCTQSTPKHVRNYMTVTYYYGE